MGKLRSMGVDPMMAMLLTFRHNYLLILLLLPWSVVAFLFPFCCHKAFSVLSPSWTPPRGILLFVSTFVDTFFWICFRFQTELNYTAYSKQEHCRPTHTENSLSPSFFSAIFRWVIYQLRLHGVTMTWYIYMRTNSTSQMHIDISSHCYLILSRVYTHRDYRVSCWWKCLLWDEGASLVFIR